MIIWENERALCIPDKNPLSEYHLLIIPKRHVERVDLLKEEEVRDMWALISRCIRALEKKRLGVDLRQNWRPFLSEGPLVVRHVHVHVISRRLNDRIHLYCGGEDMLRRSIDPKEAARRLRREFGD